MIMVSVLVITYNQQKYISMALDSVLSQSVDFEYEILIGDDHSTDGTAEVIKRYHKMYPDRIRVFTQTENKGASFNLYTLLSNAKGRYIAELEGDDRWSDPDKLRLQTEFLEKNSEYSGCCGKSLVISGDGSPSSEQYIPWLCRKREYRFRDFKGVYLPGQTSTMMYRNIFSSCIFFEQIYKIHPQISDRTIVMIYSLNGKIYRFDRVLGCYRKNSDGSVTDELYGRNFVMTDYRINEQLEKVASGMTGRRVSFTGRKFKLCASALLRAVIYHAPADLDCLKEISACFGRIRFWVCAPFFTVAYLISKIGERINRQLFNGGNK